VVLVDTLAPPTAATAATLISARGATPTTLCLVPSSSSSSSSSTGAGAVLVVGDDAGECRGYDVRVLDDKRPLWSTKQQQHAAAASGSSGSNGITSLACWDAAWMGGSSVVSTFDCPAAGSSGSGGLQQCGLGGIIAAGSRDGSISVLHAPTGTLLQHLPATHYTERKGLLERVTGGLAGASGRSSTAGGPLDELSSGVVLRARPPGAVSAAVSGLQGCPEGLVSCGWDGVVRFAPFAQLLDDWSERAAADGE